MYNKEGVGGGWGKGRDGRGVKGRGRVHNLFYKQIVLFPSWFQPFKSKKLFFLGLSRSLPLYKDRMYCCYNCYCYEFTLLHNFIAYNMKHVVLDFFKLAFILLPYPMMSHSLFGVFTLTCFYFYQPNRWLFLT